MKKIEAYVTRDGKIHDTKTKAVNWCLENYNTKISALAHKVIATDYKYTAAMDLMRHTEFENCFKEAIAWKEDLEIEVINEQ